jgi:hypothetical protein
MKKLLFTTLILFSFITNIFAEETIGYVNGTEVNFRNEPSLNSSFINSNIYKYLSLQYHLLLSY